MLNQIKGLHHVTSMAADARENNQFFTDTLGLRRVKKTVNFDDPSVYHLYYGDEAGTPGSVMTYFPFPHAARGKAGTGEVGETQFAVPKDSLPFWRDRLTSYGVTGVKQGETFGARRLTFKAPDGDDFAMVETDGDARPAWAGGAVSGDVGIRGFTGATMRLKDIGATDELLRFMGYERTEVEGDLTRYVMPGGNGADTIDLEKLPGAPVARQGAGSVHHIAFAVEDRAAQLAVRKVLMDTGHNVTPVIDRDYFWAIYFRTPGGVLFEIATNEPGFDRDEDTANLGSALKLPSRYEAFRDQIASRLDPLGN